MSTQQSSPTWVDKPYQEGVTPVPRWVHSEMQRREMNRFNQESANQRYGRQS